MKTKHIALASMVAQVMMLIYLPVSLRAQAANNDFRRVEFSPTDVTVGSFQFRFRSAAVGDSVRSFEGTQGTEPVIEGNEVTYNRPGAVLEKYKEMDRGVEQLIVLDRNFAGSGDLVITGEIATPPEWTQNATEALGALTFYSEAGPAINFGPVVVSDAVGRHSEVRVELDGSRLALVVEKNWLAEATFPLVVRSFILDVSTAPRKVLHGRAQVAKLETTVIPATTVYSIEDTPVWRVQLRLYTADVTGADTYNPVEVKLNNDNSTWLNTGEDFYQGAIHSYDLILDHVRYLRDIQFLYISKPGSNPWYIKSYKLYVNGIAVYSSDFDLLTLGVNGSHMVWSFALRNHPFWRSYVVPALPRVISEAELEGRIQAHIGNYLTEKYETEWSRAVPIWNRPSVGVCCGSGNKVTAVLHLMNGSYVYINISLDFEFSCSSGKIFVATKNLYMQYPILDSASAGYQVDLQMLLKIVVPAKIQSDLQKVTYTNSLGQPACPAITIDWGSVLLNY